ncbi:sulfotransferase family protein [Marixanthomonas ophiurae]|uniref:Sulfotransferase family protein n=1 Tax=Marixanthomonas ophiurae TaxID=387659 RepID=A0A3E1QD45_9FLAO|nr:sulfotransferase family protein [Marixanthomonas ophiurae]RFN60042.1 hypothetical protein DZ858_08335 [Marixanthomonas ophiurae]
MEKVFCIGFPKTGTTSLERALTLLDYNVCKGHYSNSHSNYLISLFVNKDFKEIDRIISYYDAFVDLPWGGTDFYLYLSKTYPDAKFIHTVRDPEKWYVSLENMLTKLDKDKDKDQAMEVFHKNGRYGLIYYLERVLKIQKLSNEKGNIINQYIQLNKEINTFFEGSNYSYLNLSITEGDSWDVLCSFLNKEIPTLPFPSGNKGVVANSDAQKKRLKTKEFKRNFFFLFKKK